MAQLILEYRVGDIIDAFMAMMVLRTCEQVEGGLPASIKSKMMMNIVLDFGIGLVRLISLQNSLKKWKLCSARAVSGARCFKQSRKQLSRELMALNPSLHLCSCAVLISL